MSADKIPVPLLPIAVVLAFLAGKLLSVPVAPPPHLKRISVQEVAAPTPVPTVLAGLLDAGWLLADPEPVHARGGSIDVDPDDPVMLTVPSPITPEQLSVTARGTLLVIAGPYAICRRDKNCTILAADRLPAGPPSPADLDAAALPFTFEGKGADAEPISTVRVEAAREGGSDVLQVLVRDPGGKDLQHGFVRIEKPWVVDRLTLESVGETANVDQLMLQQKR